MTQKVFYQGDLKRNLITLITYGGYGATLMPQGRLNVKIIDDTMTTDKHH